MSTISAHSVAEPSSLSKTIAGIVVANKGVLLTRNRRLFERVPGLSLPLGGRESR